MTGGGCETVRAPVNNVLARVGGQGKRLVLVVGARTGHLRSVASEDAYALTWNEVFVDGGAARKEEAQALGIHPRAAVISNRPEVRRLGNHIVGKAVDDRAARLGVGPVRRVNAAKQLERVEAREGALQGRWGGRGEHASL